MSLFDCLKSLVLILLILFIAPIVWGTIKEYYGNFFESRTKIGVLPIRGIIYDSSFYVKELQHYFSNPEIKGIVLKIECPATAAGTGETIYSEIQALKRRYPKPVIGLVENICTAGGYWIACAADYLIAPGTAIIGNISATIPLMFRLTALMKQYNITYPDIKVETYHAIMNPFIELTNSDKELIQAMYQDTYQQFIHVVAQARKVSLAKVDQWADGKTFTGQQAYKLRLIDEIGSLQHLITVLKQKALIEGDIKWVYPAYGEAWVQTIFGMSNARELNIIKRFFDAICASLESQFGQSQMS